MARNIKEILEELFKGKEAALGKYSRVRMTQYELNLWKRYGFPLSEVDLLTRKYFQNRFLNGQKINLASEKDLKNAYERLGFAVSNGCKERCTRLMEELNESLKEQGIDGFSDIDWFLDWLTFRYFGIKDPHGDLARCPRYGYEIRIFDHDKNRKEFWDELQSLMKSGRMMPMQRILQIVEFKRKYAKPLE